MTTRIFIALIAVFAAGIANAQSSRNTAMNYNFAEFRYVDSDLAGGDGFKLGGSYHVKNNWLVVGSLTQLSFDGNVDGRFIEIGAGYVWPMQDSWDIVASARYVDLSDDLDDSGVALEGGLRGFLAPQVEIRGSLNHITVGDGDTFLEFGGDYYFTDEFAAGLTLEFAGDNDIFTLGARWFFR